MEFSFGALLFFNGSGVNGMELDSRMTSNEFFDKYLWVVVLAVLALAGLTLLLSWIYIRRQKVKKTEITIHLSCHSDIQVQYGRIAMLPTPKRDGYEFRGWFLDSACTIPFDSRIPIKRELILYPRWEKEVG